ncbi:HK97 family phage prohead protease [Futiania mangrovi]|uniref:HK97 family phage prohead protease n=1 Tax=Futiania mangrovi TaxID=2959716 RepID=A0A9J6PAZ6_9PROT|nr:HK97 family phage prohead protease [Futiania mangrovii]MCP1337284.1 HK97 family phage prohead protease [Futiania mangrovii]
MLETKFTRIDAGCLADGVISGHASLFDVADDSGDVVAPGAFAASLARRPAQAIRFLWQHDPGEPIGVWEELVEDGRGLRVRGRLVGGVPRAASAAALLSAGALDGLSIGFRTAQSARLPGGGRRLLEIDLWEISLVTFPMLPGARAQPLWPPFPPAPPPAVPAADDSDGLADALRGAASRFA